MYDGIHLVVRNRDCEMNLWCYESGQKDCGYSLRKKITAKSHPEGFGGASNILFLGILVAGYMNVLSCKNSPIHKYLCTYVMYIFQKVQYISMKSYFRT